MYLKFVGSQIIGGISQDFEHQKYYWGPENNWTCEIPDRFGVQILQGHGEAYQVVAAPVIIPDPNVLKKEPEKPKRKK